MCWTLNHQNIIEISQRHISLSISPFLVIYANTFKSNAKHATLIQIEDQIVFDSNLAYLDNSLPPLGLFLQIKFIFLLLELALPGKLTQQGNESDVNKVSARDGNSSVNPASQGHCTGVFIGA
jgi:hypothetical protein